MSYIRSVTAFGDAVRRAREQAGLTQEQLADAVGVDRKTIGRWERGETTDPEPTQIRAIIRATNVEAEDLLRALGLLPSVIGHQTPMPTVDPDEVELYDTLKRLDMPEADRQLLMTVYRQRRDAGRPEADAG